MRFLMTLVVLLALGGVTRAQDAEAPPPYSSGNDEIIVCIGRFDAERIVLQVSAWASTRSFVSGLYGWASKELKTFRMFPFEVSGHMWVRMPQCFATAPMLFSNKVFVHSKSIDRNGSIIRLNVSEVIFKGQHLFVVEADLTEEL